MKHTTIKEIKLATQKKQEFHQLKGSYLRSVWDGSSNDPSLLAQMLLKCCRRVNLEMQESVRLLI